jgi:hypothetical protein
MGTPSKRSGSQPEWPAEDGGEAANGHSKGLEEPLIVKHNRVQGLRLFAQQARACAARLQPASAARRACRVLTLPRAFSCAA